MDWTKEIGKTKYRFADTIARHSQGKVYAIKIVEKLVPPGTIVREEEKELLEIATIVSLTKDDFLLSEGGNYSHDSRKLYCYHQLDKGDKILNIMNNGTRRTYTVMEQQDKSDYDDGLQIYYLERGAKYDNGED